MLNRWRTAVTIFVLLLVVSAAGLGISTGVTVDNDAIALESTFASIWNGVYQPSRTSGFPGYEFPNAVLWKLGGVTLVMVGSLIATLVSLVALAKTNRITESSLGLVAWAFFALSPIVLTNSSAVMETAWLACWVGILLLLISMHNVPRWALFFTVLAMVLTRPDSIALSAVIILASLFSGRKLLILPTLAGSFVGVAITALLAGKFPFLPEFIPQEPVFRRFARGAIGLSTLLGPIGVVSLVIFLTMLIFVVIRIAKQRKIRTHASEGSALDQRGFLLLLSLLTLLVYGSRFLILSDEIEYALPALMVLVVAAPRLFLISRVLGAAAMFLLFSIFLTSIVSVTLLSRSDPLVGDPQFSPALETGGFIQDWALRQATSIRNTDGYQEWLDYSTDSLELSPSISFSILPTSDWHFITNLGYRDYFANSDVIVGCSELTSGTLLPGWRVSQTAGNYDDLLAYESGQKLHCGVVAIRNNNENGSSFSLTDFGKKLWNAGH